MNSRKWRSIAFVATVICASYFPGVFIGMHVWEVMRPKEAGYLIPERDLKPGWKIEVRKLPSGIIAKLMTETEAETK